MADSDSASEEFHVLLAENVAHEALSLLLVHPNIVGDDAGRILTSMLKMDQAVIQF